MQQRVATSFPPLPRPGTAIPTRFVIALAQCTVFPNSVPRGRPAPPCVVPIKSSLQQDGTGSWVAFGASEPCPILLARFP